MLRVFAFAMTLIGSSAVAAPLLILVSIDGARWDYPELHDAPFLQELAAAGTRVERLTPSFPTKTFPNHYTLVTGMRPATHGIVQNQFFDPDFEAWFGIGAHPAARDGRWWGGEPIWLTAQRQGQRTACMFWPGSEADIHGQHPDTYLRFDDRLTPVDRVNQVLTWTARPPDERPHLITLYFDRVDSAGHDFGPCAPETRAAFIRIDAALAGLRAGLRAQGLWDHTNLIVTADHGMTASDPADVAVLDELVPLDAVESVFSGAVGGLNVVRGDIDVWVRQLDAHPHLRAYRREDVPERLHFSANPRIPDIVVIPDRGWHLSTQAWIDRDTTPSRGDHGYDPAEPDMGALFIAHGPAIPRGKRLPPADNIHVYNLLCALLGIEPSRNDGDDRLLNVMTGRHPPPLAPGITGPDANRLDPIATVSDR